MALDHDRVAAALPTYEIGEEIGRGAWGVVLRGRHRHLDRPVAVKELPRAFGADPTVRHRFTVEARLLATLDHPHIVPVYDYVESDGICLLVMELLPGGTVWDRFTGEGVPAAGACGIAIATCSALHHAHERGILHRDIKPENLLFSGSGTLKVSDFGIAKVMGGAASMATRTGLVLGTPAYMAPEQVTGVDLTPATDVYAVGTVLYELLSGRLPFRDDGSALALLYQRAHEDPAPLVEVAPDLPPDLIEVTMRAIARDPADRYQTADEMGAALADAAAAAWGRDWVSVGGIKLLAAGAIAERITDPRLPRSVDATAPAGAADLRSPASVVDAGPSVRDGTEPEVAGLAVTPEDLVPVQAVVAAEADRPVAAATIADAPPSPTPPPAPPPAAAPPPSARPAPAATPAAAPAPPPSARPAPAAPPAAAPPAPARSTPAEAPPVPPLPPPSRTSAPPEPSTGRGREAPLPGATPPPVPEAPARAASSGGPPRWFLAAVALVVVVVAVVAVSRVVGRRDASVAPSTSPQSGATPQLEATVVAAGLDHLAPAGDGVWASDGPRQALLRIDGTTDAASVAAMLPNAPRSIATTDDSVWVTTGNAGPVLRIQPGGDPGSPQLISIPVNTPTAEIAAGQGAVWVTAPAEKAVLRIDPASNQVVGKIVVGDEPDSIGAGEGAVWVANRRAQGSVQRIDPATNAVTASVPVGANPDQLAVGEGAVWVASPTDGTVSRIDPSTNRVSATIKVGNRSSFVVVALGSVWAVNGGDGTVSRIDPATNAVTATVPVGREPEAGAGSTDAVWVINHGDGTVSKIGYR